MTLLLAALSAQLFCQLIKFIVYSLREGRITPKYFFISGGFISAHSALVSTLVAYLALTGNVGSPWFSISAVFAIIVIHDALKLRRNVEEQSKVINKLIAELPDSRRRNFQKLSEHHGHSGVEVVLGIIFGTFYAAIFRFFTSLL